MNPPPIIGNGWVEAYLFGTLTPSEMKAMEQLIFNQKDWNDEWNTAIESLETLVRKWEITPDPSLRKKVFEMTGIPQETLGEIPTPEHQKPSDIHAPASELGSAEPFMEMQGSNALIESGLPPENGMPKTSENSENRDVIPLEIVTDAPTPDLFPDAPNMEEKPHSVPAFSDLSENVEPVTEPEQKSEMHTEPDVPMSFNPQMGTPKKESQEIPAKQPVIPTSPKTKSVWDDEPQEVPRKKREEKNRSNDKPKRKSSSSSIRPGLVILFLVAFASLTAAGYFLFESLNQTQSMKFLDEEIIQIKKEKAAAESATLQAEEKAKKLEADLGILQEPGLHLFELKGKPLSPDASALVGWNYRTGELYLTRSLLPPPAQGKQYQIWGIKDSIIVDGGVIPLTYSGKGLLMLKEIEEADAFAITLEDSGGAKWPSVQQMHVLGKVQ